MRILSIVEVLGVGGGETVAVDLVTGLPEHEHVLWHLSTLNGMPAYGPHLARLKAALVPVRDVHWRDVAEPDRRATTLEGFTPDVVIAHWWGGDPWHRWVVQREPTSAPWFVCVAHSSSRPLEPGFDRYVLVAAAQAAQMRHLPRADVRVIPNGTDLTRFEARSAAEESDPARPLSVGSLAGLRPGKVGSDLVRTLAGWRVPNARYHIAGDGPLRASMEADASASERRDEFEFLGHVPSDSVPRFLASLDVLCHLTAPGVRDTCPLAVVESLAAGVPVVALASGGVPELIEHERNGLLASTPADVGSYLRQLAADRQLLRRLAAGARETRPRLDVSHQLAAYRELLAGLAGGRDAAGAHATRAGAA